MSARNPSRSTGPRLGDARALVGVIVAGLLLGGVASVMLRSVGEWLAPDSAEAQAAAAKAETAAVAPVARVTTGSKPATTVAKTAAPVTKATKPVATNAKLPAGAKAGPKGAKAGAPVVGSSIVQSSAHLDEQLTYQYNALGRRDPFQSLLTGEYVGADVGGEAPPDVGGLKVVGIVWGDADQFALVEDARGDSHILRRGDKVMNGYVEALKRDAMVVNLTVDGQSQSVTVPLTRKGEKTNANR
jgi:hypothetical protein